MDVYGAERAGRARRVARDHDQAPGATTTREQPRVPQAALHALCGDVACLDDG